MAKLLKLIHFCRSCELGYEIEVPRMVQQFPFEFVCPGCSHKYEARLAFVDVHNRARTKAQVQGQSQSQHDE